MVDRQAAWEAFKVGHILADHLSRMSPEEISLIIQFSYDIVKDREGWRAAYSWKSAIEETELGDD